MSFLYPLFLVAGLALAIPVLIHLFNLRRYKTVLFPHTRFLKNIQLNSRRQSQVRYKWLLAMRLLFLLTLILAFAQPFFNKAAQKDAGNKLQVVYVDNSNSMGIKKGTRTLLDIAREAARRQLLHARPGTRFLLLTNDKPYSYQPQTIEKVLSELQDINLSANARTASQVLSTVQSMVQGENANGAELYYYSDFQQSSFPAQPDKNMLQNITFYGIPVQADDIHNLYIDTAFLTTPVLQTGQNNYVVVRTRNAGSQPKESPVLQLTINGQVKSSASLSFNDKNESIDTLGFHVDNASWQKIQLTVNDASVHFDDTFRITARSSSNLSVLVLNEGQPSPYIGAAFHTYNSFRLTQQDATTPPADWKDYNLVILNGITHSNETLNKALNTAMQQGLSVCIFPGKTSNFTDLNNLLKQAGDIHITAVDTATQTVASLQQGSSLVKDLFEQIPENVQLPVANWHYTITSGLSANQQSILSFRNGDPFFAAYTPSAGQLYICAAPADLQSGNFAGSYFFAPFLYQMAVQAGSSNVYAITAGKQQPIYLPMAHATERNIVHIYGNGNDIIPPQHPGGSGLEVFADQAIQQPGFYNLVAEGSDTTSIALNQNHTESEPAIWGINALKTQWAGKNISWVTLADNGVVSPAGNGSDFPLWKVCVILALIMLAAETYLLAGGHRKQNIATQ